MPPATTEFQAERQYSDEIRSVSSKDPCPLCNGEYQCYTFGDRVCCAGLDEAPSGWERLKQDKNGRWIFAPVGSSSRKHSRSGKQHKTKKPKVTLPNADEVLPLPLVNRTDDDFPQWEQTRLKHGDQYEKQIEYLYPCPETGELLGKVVRKQWSDRRVAYGKNHDETKEVRPWHWVEPHHPNQGTDGWWSDRGKGRKKWGLYRQQEIELEIAAGEEIPVLFYVAGEQQVETTRRLGLWAVTNQGGEGSFQQQVVDFVGTVKPRLFVIWPDNDPTGQSTSEKLLKAALKAGIPTINLDPLGIWEQMPHKGDITNVVEDSGMTGDEIVRALEEQIRRQLDEQESSGDDSDWAGSDDGGRSKDKKKIPTPKALADSLYEDFREKWAYDLGQKSWRIWNGAFWERRDDKVAQKLLKSQVQAMDINYSKESYIKDALESLSLLLLKETWQSFDRSLWIAGANGVLNITTGKVESHQPGFGFTSVLPHEVRPFLSAQAGSEILSKLRSECPEVYHFFSTSMLEDEQRILKLLAVIAGIIRYRYSKLQRFVHIIGEPGTGKGTFLRLLKDVVGFQNCQSASLTNLHDGNVIARIIDAQLVLFPDERKQVGVEWLLKLTGEDDVDFRENYTRGNAKRFAGTIAIASNNAIFAGDTTGIDRRLDLIPFQNIIPGTRRDPDLQEKLKAEVPDLVSVALSMPLSLVDDLVSGKGIGKMPDIRWHEWQMKLEVDKVASFVDEMLIEDEERGSESATYLFDSYLEWSKTNNHSSPGSNTFFGGRLKKHLDWIGWRWEKVKSNGKFTYKGFRLRREGEDTPTVSERLLPSGTVKPSLRDSSGIVLNPDGARDRDSRDSFSPKTFEKSEVTEISTLNQTAQAASDGSEKNKDFPPGTIPTIPIAELERVLDYPQTVSEGQCELSLSHDGEVGVESSHAHMEQPAPVEHLAPTSADNCDAATVETPAVAIASVSTQTDVSDELTNGGNLGEAAGVTPGNPDEEREFQEMLGRSDAELRRLGWTTEQGKCYLLQTYNKRSRQLLYDQEMREFLTYLEALPTPPTEKNAMHRA